MTSTARRWHTGVLGAIATTLVLFLPAPAGAAVHNGSLIFDRPTNPPSIGTPPPPADHQNEYDQAISVTYDDQSGTVTLRIKEFAPEYWGPSLPTRRVFLLDSCAEKTPATVGLSLNVYGHGDNPSGPASDHTDLTSPPPPPPDASAFLSGTSGQVNTVGTFDGQVFTFLFTDPHFVGLLLRCVTTAFNSPATSANATALDGYPAPPTPLAPAKLATHPATRRQVRAMFNATRRKIRFDSNGRLNGVLVTSNNWALAFATEKRTGFRLRHQPFFFHYTGGRWHLIATAPARPVPAIVLQTFGY